MVADPLPLIKQIMQGPTQKPKSFVQALTNVCDIPMIQLPEPCVKGDRITITIPEDEYLVGVEAFKTTPRSYPLAQMDYTFKNRCLVCLAF